MPRHNEEEIQLGIRLFKRICDDAKQTVTPGKPTAWSGHSCAGGGWKIRHKMNEDSMTPANVVRELELNSIIKDAKAAYDAAILRGVKKLLG
jgi:hypothetical protein